MNNTLTHRHCIRNGFVRHLVTERKKILKFVTDTLAYKKEERLVIAKLIDNFDETINSLRILERERSKK